MVITVGELIERLSVFDADSRVIFGDRALDFYRLKHRGTNLETGERIVQLEFVQEVYRDRSGKLIARDVE